ncbi:MAG: glycosyltransferase family 2 protein [Candidatus Omnitrophica bacterium]|nr:glycosyltransferase family 2 protein [Candidatus Omnitrophota bacterium]MDE2230996.1 glycosyltransferase family 2 protein [Candidatus Omnitrophota bacterium]
MDLSIVIPVNNEEQNIGILYERLKDSLKSLRGGYEIIFVEDGSKDNSYGELCAIHQRDKSVNVVKLKKNFGQTMGLLVGMNFVRSEVIITMDGDLQHDPQDILKLVEKINMGYDVVNGKKERRKITKRLICLLFGLGYYDINSSFRAYRSKIVNDIKDRGEAFRFLPLLAREKKINLCEVDIACRKRKFGKTHYHFMGRLNRLARDVFLLLSMRQEKGLMKKIDPGRFVSELRFH